MQSTHDAAKRHTQKLSDEGANISDDSVGDENDRLIPVDKKYKFGPYDPDKRKQRCCTRSFIWKERLIKAVAGMCVA